MTAQQPPEGTGDREIGAPTDPATATARATQPPPPGEHGPPEPTLDLGNLPEIAAWMAQIAAEGVVGGAVFAYVDGIRRRFGARGSERLKEAVLAELRRVKRRPGVSDADLRLRVERLFDEHDR